MAGGGAENGLLSTREAANVSYRPMCPGQTKIIGTRVMLERNMGRFQTGVTRNASPVCVSTGAPNGGFHSGVAFQFACG